MKDIIELEIIQILLAYIFVVLLLIIVRTKGIKREKEIIIACIRMTIQLILTGYLLVYLFEYPSPILSVLLLLMMEVFSVFTVLKRIKKNCFISLKKIIAISMIIGTLSCILYFLFVVIRISPWYNPRYFIPIAGMIIGNSMTGITIGISKLIDGFYMKKELIEESLILGATPKDASKKIVNEAYEYAIIPTINSMLGMGIVFLPGMMTGQILSGTLPVDAIKYQIAIMLGILGGVALTVFIVVQLGYKTFFNEDKQLII